MAFPQRGANHPAAPRERVAPQSLEAEQSTLGAMMMEPEAERAREIVARAVALLKAEYFYRELHRKIFMVIVGLFEKGEPVDMIMVVEELRRREQLEEVGGAAYLTALIEACPSAENIESYAKVVVEKSVLRGAALEAETLTRFAYGELSVEGDEDAMAFLSQIGERLVGLQKRAHKKEAPSTISAADLELIEYPPTQWIVQDLLSCGLYIFGGKVKMGKSWLAQSLAFSVAFGGHFLGTIEVEQGEVLYIALEDTFNRLQDRQRKVLRDADGKQITGPKDLYYQINWPRADEGGIEMIEDWLDDHPRARLVVVDILQKFRSKRKRGGDIYEEDYDTLSTMKKMADARGITILVLHHLSKRETDDLVEAFSGSVGVTGAADGTWALERKRADTEATLHVSGRDVGDEQKALRWSPDTFAWTMLGDAEEIREKSTREKILDALRAKGETLSPSEIAEDTDLASDTIRKTLRRMEEDGDVLSPRRGAYRLEVEYKTNANTPPAGFVGADQPSRPKSK